MRVKLIGKCGVDSGTLLIVDPCYIKSLDSDEERFADFSIDPMRDEGNIYQAIDASEGRTASPVCSDLAVATTTGYGDGYYNVYAIVADTIDTEGWGTRVLGIFVDFDDTESVGAIESIEDYVRFVNEQRKSLAKGFSH